jgi:membrane protein YqaA with SNARE-associated domain
MTPTLAIFLWSFAEAICWPFMPDALLLPLCVVQPDLALQLIPCAMCGSALGSCVSYLAGKHAQGIALLRKVPFVRQRMIDACRKWFHAEGFWAVRRQPISNVPFKVFAATAGELKLPMIPFIALGVGSRGLRFSVVAIISRVIHMCFYGLIARFPVFFMAAWCAGFYLALTVITRTWDDPAQEKGAHLAARA